MAIGDRAAKRRELDQAISDCVQRKRQISSDAEDERRTLERVARYREDAARLSRQADDMEANARDWRARLEAEDRELERLRTEKAALRQEQSVLAASQTLQQLEALSTEQLEQLLESRPDLAPVLEALYDMRQAAADGGAR